MEQVSTLLGFLLDASVKDGCVPVLGGEVLFIFFTRLFDRRMFSSKDCFAGQSPGIGHDARHLYIGGPWMCRGEGQVQARLLRRGLEVWCSGGLVTSARISLMEGVLPSRLWQPDRSWSRRDAAEACMAACVSWW